MDITRLLLQGSTGRQQAATINSKQWEDGRGLVEANPQPGQSVGAKAGGVGVLSGLGHSSIPTPTFPQAQLGYVAYSLLEYGQRGLQRGRH